MLPDGRVAFTVWAPRADAVDVVRPDAPPVSLVPGEHDTFTGVAEGVAGQRYRYRLRRPDGTEIERPDPASRHQPDGVHGPSAVDDPDAFGWTDQGWAPPARHQLVIYELHVGTFTSEGTFDAAAERLPELAEDGITAVELLPVAQFPGARNWGYDGVLPYAVQDSYGGPEGLRRFVDAAHAAGVAVLLDVVYNHVGPEGNVLDDFGPYFTEGMTPWGAGLNVDGPDSDHVRRFVVENAVRWIREFHIDGLRLDAVHAIYDTSAVHLLQELAEAVHAEAARQRRTVHVIAESDLQDPRLVRPAEVGGYGLDGQWADDLHHVLHTALTGEDDGYYVDFAGLRDLPDMIRDRFVYAGRYSAYRRRHVGAPARDVPHDRFVVCLQNHDQVGNRPDGARMTTLVADGPRRAATALLLSLPFTPMLFMGEEYGETRPFPFFTSHGDPELIEAVRTGRREEFASFAAWQGEVPDPQDEATFRSAVLDWGSRGHAPDLALVRRLLELRRQLPAICDPLADEPHCTYDDGLVRYLRTHPEGATVAVLTLLDDDARKVNVPGHWRVALDSRHPTGDPGTVTDTLELSGPATLLLVESDDGETRAQ